MLLTERSINIAGGNGGLGTALVRGLRDKGERVFIGNRTGEGDDTYKIGSGEIFRPNPIGIIATTADGVRSALGDFENIPTLIATTGYKVGDILERPGIRVDASNLALPIVSLFKIFSDFEDFRDMKMYIHESHQAGKKDFSGTAARVRNSFIKKGGICDLRNEESYNPYEGVSDLGGIITYRGSASSREMKVIDEFMGGHAYHHYKIKGSGESFELFKEKISEWNTLYGSKGYTGYYSAIMGRSQNSIEFGHTIDGRDIYADGLHEVLPWLESLSPKVGNYNIEDYVR